ncbi:maltodextrin phosphorylase [Achromatium sp. WMS3]|nr:maltodextrin phosphorylase [Achromatium sp. WMS3]
MGPGFSSFPNPNLSEIPPLGMDTVSLTQDVRRHFAHTLGRDRHCLSNHYPYRALALAIRDRLMERWRHTRYTYEEHHCRHAYYLSLEYLQGRSLSNAMLNLGITDNILEGLYNLGIQLEDLKECEPDAGLGNGGLGRLASCFMDSCATLQLPVKGYGLRYEYGLFRQQIANGNQEEAPDHWLRDGNPWELERPEYTQRVQFGGKSQFWQAQDGHFGVRWVDTQDVLAVPYDVPIPGYKNGTVNTLRLWKAVATDEFNFGEFSAGSYPESVAAKNNAEHITMVLYPNDSSENGKELRLRQQYFLASATLKDVLRQWRHRHGNDLLDFAKTSVFQLNDTHPALAVAELMRIFVDDYHLNWEQAWSITTQTMAYTNHTLLPEALERWPVRMFRHLLPRLLDIIFEINARFLSQVAAKWPGDIARQTRMSLIEESPDPMIRMAYLAIVGSFSVNGVAKLHSKLLREGLFRDFYELWPHKFNNKTNGVTPRRWLAMCNPKLAQLITDTIGNGWITDLSQLSNLKKFIAEPLFRNQWKEIKQANKLRLIKLVKQDCGVTFNPDAMFDVQVKRIHEYKRQLLNLLHVIHLYICIKQQRTEHWTPRCVLFGGKAAPGYHTAKLIIKLINNVAQVINADPDTAGLLRLAFLPNYRVSAMEVICAGTELSEQISTAGKEASGTGNMKFMMNGAITIGTYDGANIEILDAVGHDNFILFGLNAEQVEQKRQHYDPNSLIAANPELGAVMELLESGHFNQFEPGLFNSIVQALRSSQDPWMTIADFPAYIQAQAQAARAYQNQELWTTMSILNTANSGNFSTDRTIAEYNQEIWHLTPMPAKI